MASKCFALAGRGKEIIERSVQVEWKGKTKGARKHPKSRVLISIVTARHFYSYWLSCAAEEKTQKKRHLVGNKVCQVLSLKETYVKFSCRFLPALKEFFSLHSLIYLRK